MSAGEAASRKQHHRYEKQTDDHAYDCKTPVESLHMFGDRGLVQRSSGRWWQSRRATPPSEELRSIQVESAVPDFANSVSLACWTPSSSPGTAVFVARVVRAMTRGLGSEEPSASTRRSRAPPSFGVVLSGLPENESKLARRYSTASLTRLPRSIRPGFTACRSAVE